jgi:hypothetical protein
MSATPQQEYTLEYPALYKVANSASVDAQHTYMWLFRSLLISLVIAATLSLFAGFSSWLAILSALTFATTIIVSLILAAKRYDKTWYQTRAVAESVKTMTWRYIMRSKPYHEVQTDLPRSHFVTDLRKILENNRDVCQHFPKVQGSADQISVSMESIKKSSLSERTKFYNAYRIDEQRDWYTRKASENKRLSSRWFFSMWVFQFIALASALVRIAHPNWYLLPTQVLAVVASVALSWIQIKRYQDLTTSYNMAVQDIGLIKAELPSIIDEQTLSDFVINAENAFSREHTEWLARRDVRR